MNVQHQESRGFTTQHRMEHRLSLRKPCELSVTIRYRDAEVPLCTIRNTSRDGLAIDTQLTWLPRGVLVEVIVECPGQPRSKKLLAMVIHSEPGLVGLWLGDDIDQQETLRMLVNEDQALTPAMG